MIDIFTNLYLSDRLFAAVRILDPDGITRRLNDLQRHRGEYIVPGPNYIYSIDGHCKLEFWGFEIYAAIDAYSCYVIWIYVGVSSRTAISILRQYLNTLETQKVLPLIVRSDRGVETPMVASAQYEFRKKHDPKVTFSECYRFGTSTANQRIESWWGQLTQSMLFRWRVSTLISTLTICWGPLILILLGLFRSTPRGQSLEQRFTSR